MISNLKSFFIYITLMFSLFFSFAEADPFKVVAILLNGEFMVEIIKSRISPLRN